MKPTDSPRKARIFAPFRKSSSDSILKDLLKTQSSEAFSPHKSKINCAPCLYYAKNFLPPFHKIFIKTKRKMAEIKQRSRTTDCCSFIRCSQWLSNPALATFPDFSNRKVSRFYLLFLVLPIVNTIINAFVAISVFFKSHRTSQSIKDPMLQVSSSM